MDELHYRLQTGPQNAAQLTDVKPDSERVRPSAEHGRRGADGSQGKGKAGLAGRAWQTRARPTRAAAHPAPSTAPCRHRSASPSSRGPARDDAHGRRHEPWEKPRGNQPPPARTPPPARPVVALARSGGGGSVANRLQLNLKQVEAQDFFQSNYFGIPTFEV